MGSSTEEKMCAKKFGEVLKYMVKNFLTSLCLLAVITTGWAQTRTLNKPVVCDATEKVFKTIVEDFKETPQWQGRNPQQGTSTVLTVNLTTGSWTMLEYTSITACVIAVGENSSSLWGIPI